MKYPFSACGPTVEIFEPVAILGAEQISLGNYVRMSEFAAVAGGMGLWVGNFVHIASQTCISGGGVCVLEDFVGVCAGAKIVTGSDDVFGGGIPTPTIPRHLHAKYRSLYRSFVHCRAHSFIGTNASILPGVTVGEGAVIATGAVVTRDVAPWTVVAGVPAKVVRERPREAVLRSADALYAELGMSGPADVSAGVAAITALRSPS